MRKLGLIGLLVIAFGYVWGQENQIDTTGDIGIGTLNPNGRLHIKGTGSQDLLLENAGIGFSSPNNIWADLVMAKWEDHYLDLTNWSWGDAALATGLRISANATSGKESNLTLVRGSNGNLEFIKFFNTGYNNNKQYGLQINKRGSGEYNDFVIEQFDGIISNPLFMIKMSGNVGIGTANPSEKLSVDGTILAKEVKISIDGADWPDFVFSDDYTLKSLSEVENYIKTHKHLPNIPSADKMEAQGVNLAEMNRLLLQKVEELTLYVIDLEKENNMKEEARRKLDERLTSKENEVEGLEERLAKIEALVLKQARKP